MVETTTIRKGYKQTDVGVIPEDWEVIKLGEHVKITSGESPSKFKLESEGTPYFKVEQLNNCKKYQVETPYYIKTENIVKSGSILFPKRGASIFLNKIRLLKYDSYFDTNLMALTLNDNLSSEFLFYLIFYYGIDKVADTTSVPQINNKHINPLKLALPPTKTEQTAIATVLSDTDALIEHLEKLIAKKKDIKQGAMQELLTGKKRLPGFSGDWEEKPMESLFSFNGGVTASRDQLSENGHCYLHYGDIHGSQKTYIDVKKDFLNIPKLDIPLGQVPNKAFLNDGDVVFVDASEDDEGTSKHIVVINEENIPYISGLHTIVIKSKDNSMDNLYKQYCFQTSNVKKQFKYYAVGTKVSGISKINIAKIKILVPPKHEQQAIATILSDIDNEINLLEQKLNKYIMLKQGMMQELLTGRIRIYDNKQ
jgi:type I restriction enzyme S subunit